MVTPDIFKKEDYETCARQIRSEILPVGGSVFFEACLPVFFPLAKPHSVAPQSVHNEKSMLMICGSTHEASKQFIRENRIFYRLDINAGFVEELLENMEKFRIWMENTRLNFNHYKKVMITVKNEYGWFVSSKRVKNFLAVITSELIRKCAIDELLIEGGATAYACLQQAGFSSLVPVEEYSRGVVRFKIPGKMNLHLTLKPGSYEWSSKLFES